MSWEKAETLLEVLVSVAVIMIILAPTAALYIGSTRDTAMNRNDLAAQALAEEGIELMRNIRDSNLLRFSSKAGSCWDTKPDYTDLANCEDAGNKIADGNYRIAVGLIDFGWIFEKLPDAMSDNLDSATDEEYRLRLDPITHIYNYFTAASTKTIFYREIRVSKISLSPTESFLKVTSIVRYRRAGSIRSIIRSSILTPP